MDQDLVTSLVEELHVSEELARMAVAESQGELKKARETLEGLLPKYFFITARFVPRRSGRSGGLIFMLVEKGSPKFTIFRTIFESDQEWIRSVNVRSSPVQFYKIFKDYFEENIGGRRLFDAQQLKDRLVGRLSPAGLQYLFDLWDSPKCEVVAEADPLDTYGRPGAILYSYLSSVLGEVLVEKVAVDIDYDFYAEAQMAAIRDKLGLETKPGAGTGESEESKPFEGLKVYLKGQFTIDPSNGVPVHTLKVNDPVYCEVIERGEVAVSVSRLIGAYKQGLWIPVKGRITEIADSVGERSRFRLILAQGVYVDVLSYTDLLVRTIDLSPRERVTQSAHSTDEFNPMPLLVAVVLLALLIISLLLVR